MSSQEPRQHDDRVLNPWRYQPPCGICNLRHAGYEKAHTQVNDRTDYSANFPTEEANAL